jgi:hypothetical protein
MVHEQGMQDLRATFLEHLPLGPMNRVAREPQEPKNTLGMKKKARKREMPKTMA